MQHQAVLTGERANLESDLGPLAWVLDELRKSLDGATKALKRFVRDAELSRGSDLAALDASQLRIARQQLHQAVGALEMVGLEVPARMLRAMEALAQKFVQRPEFCSDEAALKVERASFALTDYLEGILKGKVLSSVALFPQYREVLDLVGDDRVHPADLWQHDWRWIEVLVPESTPPLPYNSSVRSRIDGYILNVVKTGHVPSARAMCGVSLGFAAQNPSFHARVFWAVSAGYFEAVALGLCAPDIYAKRAASRILLQYRTLARGEPDVSERLVQDLLFFCSQSALLATQDAPALTAVQHAYGFVDPVRVDYEKLQFGRFDPAVLAQARKRIAAATETWSTLSGGDTSRIKTATDQFSLVADSIVKLHPDSDELAGALTRALDSVSRSGYAPTPALAMEVATAVLYLEAAYEDLDPTNEQMVTRGRRLAQRLDQVVGGAQPEPLDGWMEELYRRVSDRQTMGSVVDELRSTLGEVETALDAYFRRPEETMPLHEVPGKLAQMRGVFSVLGLDHAALAALRMRDSVERFLVDASDASPDRLGVFEKLGNSLGALGFLIDMLSYQRELAKKLFVYDDEAGEFRSVMGRQKALPLEQASVPDSLPEPLPVSNVIVAGPPKAIDIVPTASPALAPLPDSLPELPVALSPPGPPVPVAAAQAVEEDDDAELRAIFLDEAREVVQTGFGAIAALHGNRADLDQQTSLRRSFHTLKGSSRMVGLTEFGEAAWALEQMLNAWLPQQLPVSPDLLKLAGQAMAGFDHWIEDIALGQDAGWRALPFRKAADSLRLDNIGADLVLADEALAPQPTEAAEDIPPLTQDVLAPPGEPEPDLAEMLEFSEMPADFRSTQMIDFGETQMLDHEDMAASGASPDLLADLDLGSLEPRPDADTEIASLLDQSFGELAPTEPAPFQETSSGADELLKLDDLLAPTEVDGHDPLAALDDSAWLDLPDDVLASEPAVVPEPEPVAVDDTAATDLELELELDTAADSEEQVRVIGSLRIGIPLYNVYLNEADEWSRRLLTELSEWSLELDQPVADSTVGFAHALAGSSATVGFTGLSELARALEHAMAHTQLGPVGLPEHAALFVEVAEDIRRLLHQFAAGFLKHPDPQHLAALKAVLALDLEAAAEPKAELLDAPAMPEDELLPESELQAFAPSSLFAMDVLEPVAHLPPHEDEIEAHDALDVDLFPIFEEEALELLPQLSGALRQWGARPDNLSARQESLRILHTLKGSARLAGAMRLGEMAHRMESAIEQMDGEKVKTVQLDGLMVRFDDISACFEALRALPLTALVLPEATAPAPDVPEGLAPDELPVPALALADEPTVSVSLAPVSSVASMSPVLPLRRTAGQTIRVKSQLIDRMVNQAGEVLITRSRLESRLGQLRGSLDELTGNLDRLRRQLRDVELQSESQMQSRLAQTKDAAQAFDPLEFDRFTRVQELTRMMAESVHDVATLQRSLQQTVEGVEDDLIAQARQTRELQRDLLRTRMVEFDSISERLYGVVRQAAKDFDKQVKLDIVGGSLDMDRGVLERVAAAFEHLLRNAVGHGIEPAAVRVAAGKSPVGAISITVEQHSNDVAVTFSDDGGGLDLSGIRAKALAQGQINADQVLTDEQLANLIFNSGLSTASAVSEMAGRGIGMDVVRTEVNALGGRIELSTQHGHGTQFKLVLPLTTAVTQVVLLRMGDVVMGVPASLVELVRRVPIVELDSAYGAGRFDYNGDGVAFFWAGALLQNSAASAEPRARTAAVAIFRSAGQRVAMHVDEVLGNQEVVVKNLGPQLSRLPGLAGMSVLASGAVVLIYNPVALATTYGEQARAFSASGPVASGASGAGSSVLPMAANQLPLVLVVDDSITVRRVTQRLLKREGFRVALASDGLQALELLQAEKPSVVLTDIEMPRMDGFDLVRNIRGDLRLQDLPIIMITSRLAEKHREYARALKVDHYLGKPYPEDELIGLVRGYCKLDLVT